MKKYILFLFLLLSLDMGWANLIPTILDRKNPDGTYAPLGIGVVNFPFGPKKTTYYLYDTPELNTNPIDSIILERTLLWREYPKKYDYLYMPEGDTIKIESIAHLREDKQSGIYSLIYSNSIDSLKPFSWYKGDSEYDKDWKMGSGGVGTPPQLMFRVLQLVDNAVLIVLNEKTGKTAWLKNIMPSSNLTPQSNHIVYCGWENYLLDSWFLIETTPTVYKSPDSKEMAEQRFNEKMEPSREYYWKIVSVFGDWLFIQYKPQRSSYTSMSGWIRWRNGDQVVANIVTSYHII